MPLLRLADHAHFDPSDDTGIILDTRESVYLSLNEVATLMLAAALEARTPDEAVARLRERINAPDEVLRAGLDALARKLDERTLLAPPQEPA